MPISDDPIIKELVQRIVRAGDPDRVILFGSRARGAARPGSDYDFLVIKDVVDAARRAFRRWVYRSLFGLGVSMDVIVATPEELRRLGKIIGTVLKPALEEELSFMNEPPEPESVAREWILLADDDLQSAKLNSVP